MEVRHSNAHPTLIKRSTLLHTHTHTHTHPHNTPTQHTHTHTQTEQPDQHVRFISFVYHHLARLCDALRPAARATRSRG